MASASLRMAFVRRATLVAAALAGAVGLAGCDKCGHIVHFNPPTIQKACADDGAAAR